MKDALSCFLTQCSVLAKYAYNLHFFEALRIDSFEPRCAEAQNIAFSSSFLNWLRTCGLRF